MTDSPHPYLLFLQDEMSFILHNTAHIEYQFANLMFNNTGVTLQQAVVLSFIYHNKGCNQRAVEEHLETSSASMTVLLNTISGKGLIEKQRNPVDARGIVLSLTPKGRRVFDKCKEVFRAINDVLVRDLTDEDVKHLKESLRKIADSCRVASQAIDGRVRKTSARSFAD